MWQALREELHPSGLELVTVGLDTLGAAGCREFIESASPTHPALIDRHHVLADQFGVINIPSSIWIDETGMIVRPAEAAPAPRSGDAAGSMDIPPDLPERLQSMMEQAAKIPNETNTYHLALRDWVNNGADSRFALNAKEVVTRSRPRNGDTALGHAEFALASHLETVGDHKLAIEHFRRAHRLVPESWTFRRQAWSLEQSIAGPLARFWQGPDPQEPQAWPYEGDWLSDVKAIGAENYNAPFIP